MFTLNLSSIKGFCAGAAMICLIQPVFSQSAKIGDEYPSARSTVTKGIALFEEEKYDEAAAELLKVNKNDSLYVNALYELSLTYMAAKKYDLALDVALKGLKTQSSLERDMLVQYANALDETGKGDSAINTYLFGASKFMGYYRFFYELGILYQKKKNYAKAWEYFTKSVQANPYHAASHFRLAFLAADARKTSLSVMAFFMYTIMNNDASNIGGVIDIMEKVSTNEYTPDTPIDGSLIPYSPELEELDLVLLSKGSLSSKYKSKVKLDYIGTKQLQVMMEKLPASASTDDYIIKYYLAFYKELWEKQHFEGSILYSLTSLQVKDIQSKVKAKKKEIDAFTIWATSYVNEKRKEYKIYYNGELQTNSVWYSGGLVKSIGNFGSDDLKTGKWIYFTDNGHIKAEGNFTKDKKSGTWTYYHENGKVSAIERLNDNEELEGENTTYYENGSLREKSIYKNGKINGMVELYNRNNTLKNKFPLNDGKINGIKYNFNSTGYLLNEGELVNDVYNGYYKTYYPSGAVDLSCKVVNDQINGPVEYRWENGVISITGTFANGKRDGNWKWFSDKGKLKTEINYIKGKEHGTSTYYYDNGKIRSEENYDNGNKKGAFKFYDRDGIIYAEYSYKGEKCEGYKFFDKAGKVTEEKKIQGGKLAYAFLSEFRNRTGEGMIINGVEEGEWKYYHENGQHKYSIKFEKGKKNGVLNYYYKNGKLNYSQLYKDDVMQGYYISYYLNGKIQAEGYYKDGEKHGPWNYYEENGTLDYNTFYQEGTPSCIQEEYQADGKKYGEADYTHGFLGGYVQYDTTGKVFNTIKLNFGTGPYELKTYNGRVYYRGTYKAGVKDSVFTSYVSAKQVRYAEKYKYGKRNGKYIGYNDNGKISAVGNFIDGERDSIWNYYDREGKIQRIIPNVEGEINGHYKSFYSDGKLETERYYLNDERHGEYKYYSPEGGLIYLANYEGGVLKSYTYPDKTGKLLPLIPLEKETGVVKTYYPNGNPALSFTIDRGMLNGIYTIYYSNGKPFSTSSFVDNYLTGDNIEYYPGGGVKEHESYLYDEYDGVSRYYHPSGVLAVEMPYLFGMKHGLAKYYDIAGKLTKTVRYVYGNIYE